MLARPGDFVSTFCCLAGRSADLEVLPSCALELVGLSRLEKLFVSAPSGGAVLVDVQRASCDESTMRFARALWASFALTYAEPVRLWETTTLPFLGDLTQAALGKVGLGPVWNAISVFRFTERSGSPKRLSRAFSAFESKTDRMLSLELLFCSEAPDTDTFALGIAGELVNVLGLTDDDVRSVLHRVWPGSTAWDDYLRELDAP